MPVGAPDKTVLLVSGYPELQRQLHHFVLSTGARVLCAASAAEGVEIARDHPGRIDLLVSEFRLADMPSPEFLARVRQSRPALPALVLSTEPEEVLAQTFMDSRVRFLETPFSWASLADRLSETLAATS